MKQMHTVHKSYRQRGSDRMVLIDDKRDRRSLSTEHGDESVEFRTHGLL